MAIITKDKNMNIHGLSYPSPMKVAQDGKPEMTVMPLVIFDTKKDFPDADKALATVIYMDMETNNMYHRHSDRKEYTLVSVGLKGVYQRQVRAISENQTNTALRSIFQNIKKREKYEKQKTGI